MNWDHIEGNWQEIKGKVREKWGKLTDNDLEHIAGKKDRLLGKLQQHYADKKDAIGSDIEQFVKDLSRAAKSTATNAPATNASMTASYAGGAKSSANTPQYNNSNANARSTPGSVTTASPQSSRVAGGNRDH